ncbi:MAG: Na+/H+ antiporter subunit D, partial [Clostridia bacterium]|nr:Na+/H+ antiporter subunit D [Clostridia bacterium]
IRVFTLIFTFDPGFTHTLILAIAGLTMFLGVIGAVSEMDFKRILSYHIISQVGYMVMGLGLFSPLGLAGAIFYIMHHMIVKSCLFLACGATEEVTGTTDLHKMGGVLKTHAGVSWLFLVPALSLAGVPPLSGFFSKFVLVQEGLGQGRYLIVAVSLVVSFLTLFSMLKIFRFVYWGTPPQGSWPQADKRYYKLLLPVASLAGLSVLIGLCPEWFFNLALAS